VNILHRLILLKLPVRSKRDMFDLHGIRLSISVHLVEFLSTLKRIGLFPFGIAYNIDLIVEVFCDYLFLTN